MTLSPDKWEITPIPITAPRCYRFIHLLIYAIFLVGGDGKRLGVVLKEEFFFQISFAHGDVLWMRVLVGLILPYSWVPRVSSLPALGTACSFQQSVDLARRRAPSPSSLATHTHDSRPQTDNIQQVCCFHKIVLLVKNRTTCTSTLRQLYQNLWTVHHHKYALAK